MEMTWKPTVPEELARLAESPTPLSDIGPMT